MFKFKMCSFHQDLLQVIWRSFDASNHQTSQQLHPGAELDTSESGGCLVAQFSSI